MAEALDSDRGSLTRDAALEVELASAAPYEPLPVEVVRARLTARWTMLSHAVAPKADLEALGSRLLDAWTEPHRGYHGIHHLAQIVDDLDGDAT